MSQVRDVRFFDVIVILIFVLVVGYFAQRAPAPKTSSIPGANWSEAPVLAPTLLEESPTLLEESPTLLEESPTLLEESTLIIDDQPLAPESLINDVLAPNPADPMPLQTEEGDWQ